MGTDIQFGPLETVGVIGGDIYTDPYNPVIAGVYQYQSDFLNHPFTQGAVSLLPVGGIAGGVGRVVSISRYPRAGGYGVNFGRFRLDWHRIRLGGRKTGTDYNLPHLDIAGRTKHWPWHQIDKWWRGVK